MTEVQYCTKCCMPSTRPGITFDERGVCSACQSYENRDKVDYNKRFEELKVLCDKYRGMNGPNGYDCMIAVSGGKDSHFQVHVMKELMGMNPLLVTVEDNFPMTNAGIHNLKNISEHFGCDIISMKPNIKAQKIAMRKTFENGGYPSYFIDRYIYTYPLHMAVKFNTPLLVYGENISHEYGGVDDEETYSARKQIYNGVASNIPVEDILGDGITMKDLNFFEPPSSEEMDKLDPMYMSYFVPWNSFANYNYAKTVGFHDLSHEWRRSMMLEDMDQVDSRAYLVHGLCKYAKLGHYYATDYASRMIRYGMITREEGIKLVKEREHLFDSLCVRDFCEFVGYTEAEFWAVIDKMYNRELFEKDSMGNWKLKHPVWEEEKVLVH